MTDKATKVAKELVDWDRTNARRVVLIHKEWNATVSPQIANQLDAAEKRELRYLQQLADIRMQLVDVYDSR